MSSYKKIIFLFFILLLSNGVFSQTDEQLEESADEEYYEEESTDEEDEEFHFKNTILMGLNFQLGFPQGRFGENVNYTGWGFGGNIMWKFKKDLPLYGGIDLGFQSYDFEGIVETNFDFEEIETKTRNSMALGHFQLRFYPEINFRIRPYFEGMFGAKSFLTKTTYTDVTNGNDDTFESNFEKATFAFSYGGAIGLDIPIKRDFFYIELRCAYLKGTAAEYYTRKKQAPNYLYPIEVFEIKNSVTDLLMPQIGIKYLIGFGNTDDDDEDDNWEEFD